MEKTLIGQKELAERWSCSPGYIDTLESNAVLTRVNLSKRLFPMSQIREIEKSGEPSPTLKTVKDLKDENTRLAKENKFLKKSLAEMAKVLYEDL